MFIQKYYNNHRKIRQVPPYQISLFLNLKVLDFVLSSTIGPTCIGDNVGWSYTGSRSHTQKGLPCLAWSSRNYRDASRFPDGSVSEASNFCRNPTKSTGGPWCHYMRGNSVAWDYCDIPLCSGIHYHLSSIKYRQLHSESRC